MNPLKARGKDLNFVTMMLCLDEISRSLERVLRMYFKQFSGFCFHGMKSLALK